MQLILIYQEKHNMILSISQQQLEDIIKAMKACAIFEEHKKEEILKPLREQLKSQIEEEEDKECWCEYDKHTKPHMNWTI